MDLVLCTYVINILSPEEQGSLLALASRNLKQGGYLCLEVRRKHKSASLNALSPSDLAAIVEPWGFRPAVQEEGPTWLGMMFYCEHSAR
jgi:hypothetical protein